MWPYAEQIADRRGIKGRGLAVTFWELFGLAVGAAVVFALFLRLSSWLTRYVLDHRERERMRWREDGR